MRRHGEDPGCRTLPSSTAFGSGAGTYMADFLLQSFEVYVASKPVQKICCSARCIMPHCAGVPAERPIQKRELGPISDLQWGPVMKSPTLPIVSFCQRASHLGEFGGRGGSLGIQP